MNIKFRYFTVICLFCATAFVGCDKEDNISSELGVNNLKPIDSSDPLDHYIYELYNNYGSYVLYEYDSLTYQWDFNSLKKVTFAQQKDKTVLLKGIQHIEDAFINLYPEDFRKQYLPTKILLADSINETGSNAKEDKFSESGTAYLAIGRIRDGIEDISAEDFNQSKAAINYDFWMGYLVSIEKFSIPSAFYKPSEDLYHVNLKALSENASNSSIDPKKYGFWADKYGNPHTGSYYYWTPDQDQDVEQFFEKILSHTKEEMTLLMEGYPKLQDKYNILVSHIQNQFHFDIQSIGENNQ